MIEYQLGFYKEKPKRNFQNRYTLIEVVYINGWQVCIKNKCGTLEIIHDGFLENFKYIGKVMHD